MAKTMTYSEQLRHPNWQRKRLEVLELHGFKCFCCGSKEKTLHVHHKKYIKGRMAWDYETDNFEALCEECHKEVHGAKERLDAVIASFPSDMYAVLADVLIGYGEEYVPPEFWLHADGDISQAGRMAYHLQGNVRPGECLIAADAFMQLGPEKFIQVLVAACNKEFESDDGSV
jgi:hypothetical protein